MNLTKSQKQRKVRVILNVLDEWEKEIYWRHELLLKQRWDLIKKSDERCFHFNRLSADLIEEILFPEGTLLYQVQETLL